MAISAFSRVDANARVDRTLVNPAPVNLDGPVRTVRDDVRTYNPLVNPASLEHGVSPPATPVLSQTELWAKLKLTLQQQREAEAVLASAEQAHARAVAQRARCR
jgi:hypothetical protein